MKKNIVVIGGGNGSATSINAIKHIDKDINISAVISMSDSGGSSGKLRKEFDTLPTGDIMRAVLALSSHDYAMLKQVFYKRRFTGVGALDGHNLGNLFLVLAEKYDGHFLRALDALHQALDAVGRAHPVTLEASDLCVELSNGDIVIGEHEIDRPTYDRSLKIQRAWLQPTPPLCEPARRAIEEADCIIFGPGSLYCSVIAPLLVEGAKEALQKSKARFIYIVGNGYEAEGETGPESLCDFISELEIYLPRKLDAVMYNNHALTDKEMEHYRERNWRLIQFEGECCKNRNVIARDFEKDCGGLDPRKLAVALKSSLAC